MSAKKIKGREAYERCKLKIRSEKKIAGKITHGQLGVYLNEFQIKKYGVLKSKFGHNSIDYSTRNNSMLFPEKIEVLSDFLEIPQSEFALCFRGQKKSKDEIVDVDRKLDTSLFFKFIGCTGQYLCFARDGVLFY